MPLTEARAQAKFVCPGEESEHWLKWTHDGTERAAYPHDCGHPGWFHMGCGHCGGETWINEETGDVSYTDPTEGST